MNWLPITEYRCQKWPRRYSVCRYHISVLSSSMTCRQVYDESSTMCPTRYAGIGYSFGAPRLISFLVAFVMINLLGRCELRVLIFPLFLSSFDYSIWFWNNSDSVVFLVCPFSLSFNLRLLSTPLVSSNFSSNIQIQIFVVAYTQHLKRVLLITKVFRPGQYIRYNQLTEYCFRVMWYTAIRKI